MVGNMDEFFHQEGWNGICIPHIYQTPGCILTRLLAEIPWLFTLLKAENFTAAYNCVLKVSRQHQKIDKKEDNNLEFKYSIMIFNWTKFNLKIHRFKVYIVP